MLRAEVVQIFTPSYDNPVANRICNLLYPIVLFWLVLEIDNVLNIVYSGTTYTILGKPDFVTLVDAISNEALRRKWV